MKQFKQFLLKIGQYYHHFGTFLHVVVIIIYAFIAAFSLGVAFYLIIDLVSKVW